MRVKTFDKTCFIQSTLPRLFFMSISYFHRFHFDWYSIYSIVEHVLVHSEPFFFDLTFVYISLGPQPFCRRYANKTPIRVRLSEWPVRRKFQWKLYKSVIWFLFNLKYEKRDTDVYFYTYNLNLKVFIQYRQQYYIELHIDTTPDDSNNIMSQVVACWRCANMKFVWPDCDKFGWIFHHFPNKNGCFFKINTFMAVHSFENFILFHLN